MAAHRAGETQAETAARREKDAASKASTRQDETPEEAAARRKKDAAAKRAARERKKTLVSDDTTGSLAAAAASKAARAARLRRLRADTYAKKSCVFAANTRRALARELSDDGGDDDVPPRDYCFLPERLGIQDAPYFPPPCFLQEKTAATPSSVSSVSSPAIIVTGDSDAEPHGRWFRAVPGDDWITGDVASWKRACRQYATMVLRRYDNLVREHDVAKLRDFYDCHPATYVKNTMRLAPLRDALADARKVHGNNAAVTRDLETAFNVAIADAKADTVLFGHVSDADGKRNHEDMKKWMGKLHHFVCGACGRRDPTDGGYKKVDVAATLDADAGYYAWLPFTTGDTADAEAKTVAAQKQKDSRRDEEVAFTKRAERQVSLIFKDSDKKYAQATVPATAFQNYVEVTTRTAARKVHLIPEAVFNDHETQRQSTYVCSHCAKAEKKGVFEAPHFSVAAGEDFGRRRIRCDGATGPPGGVIDLTETSQLEALIVNYARTYMVISKVIAGWRAGRRLRHHGHALTFPQWISSTSSPNNVGKAAVEAALQHVRIFVVGAQKGKRGNLERSALALLDLRLRPDRLFNWLQIRWFVPDAEDRHDGTPPPTWEEFESLYGAYYSASATSDADSARSANLQGLSSAGGLASAGTAEAAATPETPAASSPADRDVVATLCKSSLHIDMQAATDAEGSDVARVRDAASDNAEGSPGDASSFEPIAVRHIGVLPPAQQGSSALLNSLANLVIGGDQARSSKEAQLDDEDAANDSDSDDDDNEIDVAPEGIPVLRGDDENGDGGQRHRGPCAGDDAVDDARPRDAPQDGEPRSAPQSGTAGDGDAVMLDAPGARPGSDVPELTIGREEHPLSDYDDLVSLFYNAWVTLFPRRRGFAKDRTTSVDDYRHALLYYDGRFQDPQFLFTAANIERRHATNRGVATRLKRNMKDAERYLARLSSADFRDDLRRAQAAPTSKFALRFVQDVMRFVNLEAAKVPGSRQERAAEVTQLYAESRIYGSPSTFATLALDDVNNIDAVLLSMPFQGYGQLPCPTAPEYQTHIIDQIRAETVGEQRAHEPYMDSASLQRRAAANPVGTALIYDYVKRGVAACLWKATASEKKDTPIRERPRGVFGLAFAFHGVDETNKRMALHLHTLIYGGLSPAFLADVLEFPELRKTVIAAIDTQLSGELPSEYHVILRLTKSLLLADRRDAVALIPELYHLIDHHARLTVSHKHIHTHMCTCASGKWGETGCRLGQASNHGVAASIFTELQAAAFKIDGTGPEDIDALLAEDTQRRCPYCVARAARKAGIDQKTDVLRRGLAYTSSVDIGPKPAPALGDFAFAQADERAIVFDLRRRCLDKVVDARSDVGVAKILHDTAAGLTLETPKAQQEWLEKVLFRDASTPNELADTLDRSEFAILKRKLEDLVTGDLTTPAVVGGLQSVVKACLDDELVCANGVVATYNTTVTAHLGCNAVSLPLGVGTAAKAVALYLIKYLGKEGDELCDSLSLIGASVARLDRYHSTADDHGTEDRYARHFAQRVVNSSSTELEIMVAASLLLKLSSSSSSAKLHYADFWAHTQHGHTVAMASAVAPAGATPLRSDGDVDIDDPAPDFYSSGTDSDDDNDDDDGRNADDDGHDDAGGAACCNDDTKRASCHRPLPVRRGETIPEEDAADDDDDDTDTDDDAPAFLDVDNRRGGEALAAALRSPRATRLRRHATMGAPRPARVGDVVRDLAAADADAGSDNIKRVTAADGTSAFRAVNGAHLYALRDPRLAYLTALEFHTAFDVRKMSAKDKIWVAEFSDKVARAGPATPMTEVLRLPNAGRPCHRFIIREPHPQAKTHILVRREKFPLLAVAGQRPPKYDATDARGVARFVAYYAAAMMPWIDHEDYPAPDFSVPSFRQYYADLQESACLFGAREADPPPPRASSKRPRDVDDAATPRDRTEARRVIAAGRLYSIDTMVGAFQTPSALLQDLNKNHRGAHRTLWCDVDGPPTSGYEARECIVQGRNTASLMKKLLAHAEQLRKAPSLATRLERAQKFADETKLDLKCLVSGAASANAVGRLTFDGAKTFATVEARAYAKHHSIAIAANERTTFTKHTYRGDAQTIMKELKTPLAPKAAVRDVAPPPAPAGSDKSSELPTLATTRLPPEYEDITEEDWRRQSAAWHAAPEATRGIMPYNPEQRKALRSVFTAMKFTADATAGGLSLPEVTAAFEAETRAAADEDRRPVASRINLVVGPGGTGKSAIVFDLKRRGVEMRLGHLVITAYTGVASEPFGGPTILSMLSIRVFVERTQGSQKESTTGRSFERPETIGVQALERKRRRFTELTGIKIDDIAGIVIDEVFFNTTDVIGHADYAFRALTGNHDVAFGGIPVLLAGDAKQKQPPTGEAAYKTLVRSAIDPTLRAKQQLASTAGLEILRRARKTDLTTIMRSTDDPAFTALQSRLRDTGHENPLSFDFLKSIPAVSTEDVAADAAWRFALIGVLSHRERDALNIAQLRNYAQFHNIPFVRAGGGSSTFQRPSAMRPSTTSTTTNPISGNTSSKAPRAS